jgi:hypothetical protein
MRSKQQHRGKSWEQTPWRDKNTQPLEHDARTVRRDQSIVQRGTEQA